MPFRYVATFLRNERGASPARQSPESADGYPQKLWMTARRPIAGGVGRAGGWPQAARATAGQVAPAQGRAAARRRAGVCRALRCCPGRSGWHQRRRAKPQARGRGLYRPGAECQFGAALGASGVGRAGGWPQAARATAGQVAPAQGRAAARRRAGVCRALRCCPGRSGWHSGGGRRHEHAAGGFSGRVRSVSSARHSGRPG